MKLLDYSGLQRFLNKIKTLLDSKANTGHTHVTSEVTDLLNSQHTWSAQQSYSADLNLNYASTDVDDILDTVAGSYTAEDFLAQNNVWTGNNTFSKEVTLTKVNAPSLKSQNSRAELGETNLSGDTYTQISFEDKNGDNFGYLRQTYYVDGNNRIGIYVRNKFTSGAPSTSGTVDYAYFGLGLNADKSKEGVLKGTFRPYDNNAYDLGSSSYQWKSVYAKNYYYNGTAFGDIVTHNASEFSVPGHTHSASDITSGLATVATSGSYNDLSNKPTIPTVNNATLTIQKNGSTVKTFTANASSNVTANITVPTKVSELTNDSGYLTSHQSLSNYVTLNSAQTISGAKTFTGGVATTRMTVKHATVVKGTNPSSTQYWRIFNCDKNGGEFAANALSIVEGTLGANGRSSIYFKACKNTANSTDSGTLAVIYDTANNKAWAECPTPDANSNDTKIATTAWVNSKGYLTSHQSLSGYAALASNNRFTSGQIISGNYIGDESSTNARTCITFQSNRDTNGKSGVFFTKFRQNKAQGSMGSGDLVRLSLDILENEVRTNDSFMFRWYDWSSDVPSLIAFEPGSTPTSCLGEASNPWTNIYGTNYYYNGTQWGLDQANVWTSYQQMVGNPTVWNMKNNSITMGGTQPTSNRYLGMVFYDSTDVEMGRMCLQCHKNGYNYYVFSINNSDGTNSYNGSVRMAASRAGAFTLYPDAGTWNLGDTGAPWTSTYTTNLTVLGTGASTTPAVSDNSGKIATTAFVRNAIPYIISGGAKTSAGNITLFIGTIISGFAESNSVTYSTAFGGILTGPSHLYYATCIYNTSDSTMAFSKGPAVGGTGTWKLMGGGSTNPGTSTKLLFGLWIKIA